jgi:hypothetical protein
MDHSDLGDLPIRGSGPLGALTDPECAKLYKKSTRWYRGQQALRKVAAPFKIGRTNYTPPEAVIRDLQKRAERAERQASKR